MPQTYYAKFAIYLAARGFSVLTFDYRGIGRSRPAALRGFKARMRDWAQLDAAAALEYMMTNVTATQTFHIGHSFGGQSLAMVPGGERYAAGLSVASQSGYWRNWPGVGRPAMWLLTHALLPGLSRLFGHFPMQALGQGEDLPRDVAIEWAAWCRHPEYLVGHLGLHDNYARFAAPLRFYWIEDDRYAPRATVQALLDLYPNAPGELQTVSPAQHGGQRIGHFGFFRERYRDTLWRDAADWLLSHRSGA